MGHKAGLGRGAPRGQIWNSLSLKMTVIRYALLNKIKL